MVTERCPITQSNSISFNLNVIKGTDNESQQFIIPIIRDTVKIALVLDISGSMAQLVQGTSVTRIDTLKEAVYGLVSKLEELQQGMGDSLAMTYFSSNVIQPNSPISDGFIAIDNTDADFNQWSVMKVYNDLNPRTPLQMTAMGEGLLDAKNKLSLDPSPNLKRIVFLFTDGLQNHGNKVKADGISFTLTNDSLNNYKTNPKDSIQYFPVATWGAGAEPEILQEIADKSNGEVLFTTPATDLSAWFDNMLVNMLDEGSPQVVLNKSWQSYSGENSLQFDLNEHVNTLLIQLNAKDKLTLSVSKDGVNLDSKARVRSGDSYTILSFHFPIIGNSTINSGGKWEIKMNGETQSPLNLSVVVDDHYLDYECTTNKELYTVGDTLHLNTTLTHLGNAISGSANSVTAIILKPGEDLGDLLANYETPELDDSLVDIESGAAQKFTELMMNDSTFYNSLLPEEQVIQLTEGSNGTFSGYYTNTDLAGFYNIIYLMDGEIPNFGKFKRSKTVSTIFVFGQIVEEEPEVVDDAPPASTGGNKNYTVLRIRPRNKFGKYMGPGFKSKINLNINPKKVTQNLTTNTRKTSIKEDITNTKTPYLSEIKDNLDGSYYLYIANLTDTEKWDFSITVRDEVLHDYGSPVIPWWVYLIIIILLLLIYIVRKSGTTKITMWILLIIWLAVIILHYLGYLNFL